MHAKRNHLVEFVFPAFRERPEKHRIHLVDVYGVSRNAKEGVSQWVLTGKTGSPFRMAHRTTAKRFHSKAQGRQSAPWGMKARRPPHPNGVQRVCGTPLGCGRTPLPDPRVRSRDPGLWS
jgi:hypothetical protein